MKILRYMLMLALLIPSIGKAATETWLITDLVGTPQPFLPTALSSPSAPNNNLVGGYTLTNLVFKFSTDSNGLVTYTNLVPGTYVAVAQAPFGVTSVQFTITNFASTNIITNNPTVKSVSQGLSNAYPMIVSDARYPSVAGSNITFTFTNGQLVVSASGGGGSANAITNFIAGSGLAATTNAHTVTATTNGQVLSTNFIPIIPATLGGLGVNAANLVPPGADYDDGTAEGFPVYTITAPAGIYFIVVTNTDAATDSGALNTDFSGGVVNGFFTNNSTSFFMWTSGSASTPVLSSAYTVSPNTIAANVFAGNLKGTIDPTVQISSASLPNPIIGATVQSSAYVNTSIYTGPGSVSTHSGSHYWTNSATHGLQPLNLFIAVPGEQYSVIQSVSTTVFYTFEPAVNTHTSVSGWQYYSNYQTISDSVPRVVGGMDGSGGFGIAGGSIGNSGAIWYGIGSSNCFKTTEGTLGSLGEMWSIISSGLNGQNKNFLNLSHEAPAQSFDILSNGVVSFPNGITNDQTAGGAIPVQVPLTLGTIVVSNAPTFNTTNAQPAGVTLPGGVLTIGTNKLVWLPFTNNGLVGSVLWIKN